MSLDRVPPRSEVMGWSPQQLAEYLKRINLTGCDKTVTKNSISGSRFVNLSDNDLQKFPKTYAPMISKISNEISKKEEKRGLFGKKSTPKYHEPNTHADAHGWGEDEFEDDFDDDYESPFSGDEDGSGGDYESPNEDVDGNDYEPPPTEPPDDLPPKLCRGQGPIGDDDYIDNHVQSRSNPPALSPRPPTSTLSAPSPRHSREPSTGRDPSPHCGGRPTGKLLPEPPQIFRSNKPGRPNPSPIRGPQRSTLERPVTQGRKSQPDAPDPPNWSKPPALPPNSISSARPSANRFDDKREQGHGAKHNTFPLHNKGLPPRPGIPGPASRQGDSLPPNVPPPAASLPHKLQSVLAEHRASFSGSDSRQSFRPPPPTTAPYTQELDPVWYVGKVTRGQAEGGLKRVNKDGAYLVRDSTRQQANQPFTLMVFYQDKVYNIQIRQQNQQFMLGTGLKAQECFPSVRDIISHYSQSPLLLIDAKNRSSNQQNQCVLSDPAGYYMSGQSWS
ncbi:lymphocyte cytosolic protein 2a isoform X2 [Channa argus]|uniref:lymphocyte cytosolic protein 2a isoform X2 n=1 Tax=Channa argus TaxID=215402 RepID=UPI0035226A35